MNRIRAIAETLALSSSTVSRALRNNSSVNPETRAKVLDLATQQGFRPRQYRQKNAGKAAAKNATTIGVLIAYYTGHNFYDMSIIHAYLAGLSKASGDAGITLSIRYISDQQEAQDLRDPEYIPFATQQDQMLGLVLIYLFPNDVAQNLTRRYRCVSIHNDYRGLGIDCAGSRQTSGVGVGVEHLYKLGHRKFGFVDFSGSPLAYPRFAGFLQSLKQLNVPVNPEMCVNVFPPVDVKHPEALAAKVAGLIRQGVTGWVCSGDLTAHLLYKQLRQKNIAIPREASLIGYDGVDLGPDFPKLTTLRPAYEQMGQAAVHCLTRRRQDPTMPVMQVDFNADLIIGDTSAPPPISAV